MEEDDLYYLQPDFDINSLTIPRLRSILVAHNVAYASSAKKPQLVQTVIDEVLPQSRKLLSARARMKRTSKGITDMPSSQEESVDAEEEEESMPPPPVPKTPRSRKSKSNIGADDGVAATPATAKRRSRTPSARKSTSKHPRASDTETDTERPRPSARKTRKSVPGPVAVHETPSLKIEEPQARIKRESLEAGESPFSEQNPFQSGESPSGTRLSSGSRNRKSLGTSSDRRKSTSQRRQTQSPTTVKQESGITAPSKSVFSFPVGDIGSGMDPSEEFTPEATRELENERRAKGELVRRGPTGLTRRQKKKTSTVLKMTPWAILTALSTAFAAWYRQEKINVGYCGVGEPNWSLSAVPNIPAWVHENIQPVCEPCPQHAYCYPNMEVKCEDDFVLTPHPLNSFGVVPLPPTCEPDSEKARRVKAVADRAVEELRERRAAYECGEEVTILPNEIKDDIENVKTVVQAGETKLEIAEETLKKAVSKQRRKGMSEAEFEDLWKGALGDVMDREEIVVVRDGSGRVLLSSTSLARVPFSCAVRRSLLRTISRARIPLAILILFASVALYLRSRIASYRTATGQIPSLVATTLDRLATQAALKEEGRVGEGFISVGQLRDDVLRGTVSKRERERVWKGVTAVVEGNSNVRAATREGGRTGEWSRVWEWIGPLTLTGSTSPRLLRQGDREVTGGSGDGEGDEQGNLASKGSTTRDVPEVRNWDEGRPIY